MNKNILVINPGSSSIKGGLYRGNNKILDISLSGFPLPTQHISVSCGTVRKRISTQSYSHAEAAAAYLQLLEETTKTCGMEFPDVICYRVKFGCNFNQVEPLQDELITQITAKKYLGQNHSEFVAALYSAAMNYFPKALNLAIPDGLIFHGMPPEPLPLQKSLRNRCELNNIGHHGLAVMSMLGILSGKLKKRVIYCHIGSGISVTAISNGKPVWNSMSVGAIDGPMMNTRSGTLSIGIILNMLYSGMQVPEISSLLAYQSGIYGLSEIPANSEPVQNILRTHPAVASIYCEQIAIEILKAAVKLGGIDDIVFSGGIATRDKNIPMKALSKIPLLRWNFPAPTENALQKTCYHLDCGIDVHFVSIDEEKVMLGCATQFLSNTPKGLSTFLGRSICPGWAEGQVSVYSDGAMTSDIVFSEILSPKVVMDCKRAGAIIVKKGEPTSHGAAMARELQIPCISGLDLPAIMPVGTSKLIADCTEGVIYL